MANVFVTYLRESREELKKVIWPTRKETVQNSLLVVGISVGIAAFLGLIDFVLNYGLEQFLKTK